MKTCSFYDGKTGLFSGRTYTGGDVALNTPPGMIAIEGRHDYLSQRVSLKTGKVVSYKPPKPDEDHEWNAEAKRWQLKPEVAERRRNQAKAQKRIAALEQRQRRPLRELMLDPDNAEARKRLQDIDNEITTLRGSI